jgi:hypothetical protein
MSVILKTPSNGSVTLAEQDTASDVVVTVPAVTATLLNNSSGVLDIGGGQIYKDSSGNVGIGTSSPGAKLDVAGVVQTSSGYYVNGNAGGGFLFVKDNYALRFGTNDTERARIDSSGNLLVGRNGLRNGERFGYTTTTDIGAISYRNSTSYYPWVFDNNLGTAGYIFTAGSSTSYVTSSDYRLKENVEPMTGALAKVAALKPCTYTWKADGSAGQGFIAHELQAVVPDCVTGEKDAVRIVDELDDEGKVIGTKEEPQYQGVDTSFLIATLTAAIQEQQAIITQLQADVAALKGAA